MKKSQTFYDWVYNPSRDDELIRNSFRSVVRYAFDNELANTTIDIGAPDKNSLEWKLAVLLFHKRLIPEGTKVYVFRNDELTPLPEGMEDLQHLLHESEKNTAKAYGILSHELDGVSRGLVETDTVGCIEYQRDLLGGVHEIRRRINLKTMVCHEGEETFLIPEFGWHEASQDRIEILSQFFAEQNSAFEADGEFFFEKAVSYPFHQRIREKAFICNGPGGVGKTLMTKVASRLFGSKGQIGSEPTFTGQDKNRITREFIGKKFVIYNDIESPSTQLMTWLKPMLTGNMTIKGDGGFERSVPCEAVFFLETNFKPQFLGGNQDIRRFIVRSARSDYKLIDHMQSADLDVVEHECTAADVALYLLSQNYNINQSAGGWCHFDSKPLPVADFIEIAQEFFDEYPAPISKGVLTAYANQNKLTKIELETLKEVFLVEKKQPMEEKARGSISETKLCKEASVPAKEDRPESADKDVSPGQPLQDLPMSSVQPVAPDQPRIEEIDEEDANVLEPLHVVLPDNRGTLVASVQEQTTTVPSLLEPFDYGQPTDGDERYFQNF